MPRATARPRASATRWTIDTVTAPTVTGVVWCTGSDGRRVARRFAIANHGGGALLRTIDALGRSYRLPLDRRARVTVVPGPGTFGRVRLGVVATNALAWATGARTMDDAHVLAQPVYGK